MTYRDELTKAMNHLATIDNCLFLGQSVAYKGNAIFKTLEQVPDKKKIELPVFEETQMGMSIGLALSGLLPISVYPRMNFLLLAMNQLVNHLDKIQYISRGGWKPKVIIRTMIGSKEPLDPGVQHKSDFTDMLRALDMWSVRVVKLEQPGQIFRAYKHAVERTDGFSTILIEHGDYYTRT